MDRNEQHFKEGHAFEIYVINKLFPCTSYVVQQISPRRDDLEGRYIESSKDPDSLILHKRSGHSFYVECKWRTNRSIVDRKLRVCKASQYDRYKRFQEKVRPKRVYLVVGLNGTETAPSEMYCIPLEEMDHPWLYFDRLKPFERSPSKPFEYWYGRLR